MIWYVDMRDTHTDKCVETKTKISSDNPTWTRMNYKMKDLANSAAAAGADEAFGGFTTGTLELKHATPVWENLTQSCRIQLVKSVDSQDLYLSPGSKKTPPSSQKMIY